MSQKQVDDIKYIHEESVHNAKSPDQIVPVLIDLFSPESVIDIGCGIGTFLKSFKKSGIETVLGVDGSWVNRDLLFQHISPDEFKEQDLSQSFVLDKKFDLVISLEVAEHIEPAHAQTFVRNLVTAGNVIVFSAAVPNQGGQNHLNEQLLSYWKELFLQHDYHVHDILKPYFWNNPEIFFWYKQNMVVVAHKDYVFQKQVSYNPLENVIHKEMFDFRLKQFEHELEIVRAGKLPVSTYIKYLLKSFFTGKQ
ncbi:MAG: class I SAM-dependent methyltransferase [Cytophaga sp.]|uniref:class I SAM-dependent methyltransferase n=1 Tax=Cytophaga sp. TaxID=29535 RepID=UPI003F80D73A